VGNEAVYSTSADPGHSIAHTTTQVFGSADGTTPNMQGFIKDYATRMGTTEGAESIMQCFSPSSVPIVANLSMEYGFFDGWFASVPGPTEVNRCYAASATSHGMGTNDAVQMVKGLPQKTMFRQLTEMGLEYRVYYELVPAVLQFKDMRHKDARPKYHRMSDFFEHVASGDLPQYSWLEPNYYDEPGRPANDQHPDHDVSEGDRLIKTIYEAVRAGPKWNSTALIITWDEHGGFYDHVAPPMNVPSPDGIDSTDDPFDFTRLGVRVPTIVVSPWVPKGSVFHAPKTDSQYEHSSLIKTVVHKMFEPAEGHVRQPYLNKRDEWAAPFDWIFQQLDAPRTDCPTVAPDVPTHRKLYPDTLPLLDGKGKLSDLQVSLLTIVAGATKDFEFRNANLSNWTEQDGAFYCRERLDAYFSPDNVDEY